MPNGFKNVLQPDELEISENTNEILQAATIFGPLIQLDCVGYLPNKRQWMMCGLATLDVAQQLRKYWQELKLNKKVTKAFNWREFYDIIVKWRQFSEPNDPVVWVDLLTREQFEEGFGSHTPMITGQTNVIRYSPMFEKSFPIVKRLISQTGISSEKQQRFQSVKTLAEAYEIVQKDFWVCTPCESIAVPGKTYEGTRLTLQVSEKSEKFKAAFFKYFW